MRRRSLLGMAAGLPAACLCGRAFGTELHGHWSYDGETGPSAWSGLKPDYAVCGAGSEQSPIALNQAIHADLPRLDIAWASSTPQVINNGHTIQVDLGPGSRLELAGTSYALRQFHFHHPSEHILNDRSFPMEAHFVHAAADGRLAVVGVFIEPGRANPLLEQVWSVMPRDPGAVAMSAHVMPAALLPGDRRYLSYAGSLTTPPCTEIVTWLVLAEPVTASEAQLAEFQALYANNARPLQERRRRFLLSSF